ncbi:PEP-CTERM sorting domain-containing protein [Candidatus Nitrotoga sp. BS]|uniref:spherulation-specific family 4 protein n=1 Tax=Candidatus Nitrotoga sp. BS TaxID=2890408 RepID=UPI001EF3ACD4|nr:spherulation-specific family 4 protein [Candidatus Nitrotoga sp. BS]CAH1206986.1 PEP-CTERM sorting domain-containing protein [Candidatus Nitrotoga sp. BS]
MKKLAYSFLVGLLLSFNTHAVNILLPAYFYPSFDPNQSFWDEMTAAAGQVNITAIMNPNNGPGDSVNSDYTTAVDAFRAAGGKVVGYVYTSYGARSQAEVLSAVASYASFYNIDGIFLDEMSNTSTDLAYYKSLYNSIKLTNPEYRIFGNPGTNTLESYLTAADVLVTFENQTGYETYPPDTWTNNYTADHFAHLLYNVSDEAAMLANVALAADRNVGYLYITNDTLPNPWDTLTHYWNAEVSAVAAIPEPSSGLLLLAGLGLIGFRYHKFGNVEIRRPD